MDGGKFDQLTRAIGGSASRRGVLKALAGGALGAVAAALGVDEAGAAAKRSVGNSCNANSDCASGLCVQETRTRKICHCRSAADCPAAKDACHAAACLPTGYCGLAVNVGASCDDGNACTTGDLCQADGTCQGTPVSCVAIDQCHVAGACDPATGVCSNPAKPNGTPCDDGNLCTTGDACQNGTCIGGSPVVCQPLDQCHVAGTCDPSTGQCSNPAAPDNTPCGDGNSCTQIDVCISGACTGTAPVICQPLDQCHDAGTCDPATGQCSNPNAADGTPCNDGDLCTVNDACQNGVCGGDPVVCQPLDDCHLTGECDPSTGACSNPQAPDGTPCSDGNPLCLNGTCSDCAINPCANPTCPNYCEICMGDAIYCSMCLGSPGYCSSCQSDPGFCVLCQSQPGFCEFCQGAPGYCISCQFDSGYCPNCQSDPDYCFFCQTDPGFCQNCQTSPAYCDFCQSDPSYCSFCLGDPDYCSFCQGAPGYCSFCQFDAGYCANCQSDPSYCSLCQFDSGYCANCQSDPNFCSFCPTAPSCV